VSFVYTSAAWVLGNTSGKAAEDALVRPTALVDWRPEHEKLVLDAGRGRALRTAVVRPGIVYGGGRGIIAEMLKSAADGLVRVIGDGMNHWACVYDRDLADLYLRVATSPEGTGVYHATDEADERVMDIVEAVSRQAKVPPDVRHVPIEEARAKMGPYADALALNQIVRGPRVRSAGRRPCIQSPVAWLDCLRSFAPSARLRSFALGLRRPFNSSGTSTASLIDIDIDIEIARVVCR
jgi:nucleoside-diphosphate-sugar epimerase